MSSAAILRGPPPPPPPLPHPILFISHSTSVFISFSLQEYFKLDACTYLFILGHGSNSQRYQGSSTTIKHVFKQMQTALPYNNCTSPLKYFTVQVLSFSKPRKHRFACTHAGKSEHALFSKEFRQTDRKPVQCILSRCLVLQNPREIFLGFFHCSGEKYEHLHVLYVLSFSDMTVRFER